MIACSNYPAISICSTVIIFYYSKHSDPAVDWLTAYFGLRYIIISGIFFLTKNCSSKWVIIAVSLFVRRYFEKKNSSQSISLCKGIFATNCNVIKQPQLKPCVSKRLQKYFGQHSTLLFCQQHTPKHT